MKFVITTFGKMCSTAMISLILLAIIFKVITVGGNHGFFGIASALSKVDEGQLFTYTDSQKVKEIVSGELPKVFYQPEENIHKQSTVQLENCFWIKGCDSEEKVAALKWKEEGGDFQIEEIEMTDGTKITQLYHQISGKMVFPKAGIYKMQISARDKENRRTRVLFSIPVEE